MTLYEKIDNFSILLDNDCKRMLRRSSRKLIINEVLEKLSNDNISERSYIDNSNNSNNSNNNINNSNNSEHMNYNMHYIVEKKKLYEIILNIFGCNKN
tara:strand:+ start:3590 stop:3883 length:294 start_codon:yes stop_codon:yes gene_type:complete